MKEVKYFIEYVIHYKENVKELEELTIKYDSQRSEISRIREKNNFLSDRNDKHLETIKEKNKEIRKLKKENKFLIERENKLQQIETMFKNKRVLLKEIKELVENDRSND